MKFLIFMLVILVGFAQAEHNVGNGGHYLECKAVSNDEFLDFYEAKRLGFGIELGPKKWSVLKKIHFALQSIKKLDPNWYELLLKRSTQYMKHKVLLKVIPPTTDYGSYDSPADCKLVQLATRYSPRFSGDAMLAINQRIWRKLDKNQRAGLFLHEAIYEDSHFRGQPNSKNARKFVAYLVGGQFRNMNLQEYQKFKDLVGFGRPRRIGPFDARQAELAVGSKNVYWTVNKSRGAGKLLRFSRDDFVVESIMEDQHMNWPIGENSWAVLATKRANASFSNAKKIVLIPKSTLKPQVLVDATKEGCDTIRAAVVDEKFVFWINESLPAHTLVMRTDLRTGLTKQLVDTKSHSRQLALDGNYVYFRSKVSRGHTDLVRISKTGGPVEVVRKNIGTTYQYRIVGKYIYFTGHHNGTIHLGRVVPGGKLEWLVAVASWQDAKTYAASENLVVWSTKEALYVSDPKFKKLKKLDDHGYLHLELRGNKLWGTRRLENDKGRLTPHLILL